MLGVFGNGRQEYGYGCALGASGSVSVLEIGRLDADEGKTVVAVDGFLRRGTTNLRQVQAMVMGQEVRWRAWWPGRDTLAANSAARVPSMMQSRAMMRRISAHCIKKMRRERAISRGHASLNLS